MTSDLYTDGSAMMWDGTDNIYQLFGRNGAGVRNSIRKYSISGNSWSSEPWSYSDTGEMYFRSVYGLLDNGVLLTFGGLEADNTGCTTLEGWRLKS
jgi:hypothetical protein